MGRTKGFRNKKSLDQGFIPNLNEECNTVHMWNLYRHILHNWPMKRVLFYFVLNQLLWTVKILLCQIQKLLNKEFITQRDWEQFHDPKNLAISLNLESSEVLELFQWTKDNEINNNKIANLKDELADVYYWLLLLADHYDIDIENALEEKIKKNEKKYPIDKSKGSSQKYSEFI